MKSFATVLVLTILLLSLLPSAVSADYEVLREFNAPGGSGTYTASYLFTPWLFFHTEDFNNNVTRVTYDGYGLCPFYDGINHGGSIDVDLEISNRYVGYGTFDYGIGSPDSHGVCRVQADFHKTASWLGHTDYYVNMRDNATLEPVWHDICDVASAWCPSNLSQQNNGPTDPPNLADAYTGIGGYGTLPGDWVVYGAWHEPSTVSFDGYPTSGDIPLVVNFTISNASGQTFTWNFGDGSGPYSTTAEMIEHTYTTTGYFNVTLSTSDLQFQEKDNYIHATNHGEDIPPDGVYHMDVDIKDKFGAWLPNSKMGIYDGTGWYNTSCLNGACGFTRSKSGNLEYKTIYIVAADKDDYTPQSKSVYYTSDHQLVEFALEPQFANGSYISHLAVDLKDSLTGNYIPDANVSLFNIDANTWENKSCGPGYCGYTNITYNKWYTLYGEKENYWTGSTTFRPLFNYWLETVNMTPKNPTDPNVTVHLDIDVRNASDYYPIQYADIDLFDPEYQDWRNTTCVNGSCGFTQSGTEHLHPMRLGKSYQITVWKVGFFPITRNVYFYEDHQLETFLLTGTSNSTINLPALVNFTVPVFPTPVGTLSINTTVNITPTVGTLNITMPPKLPVLPAYINQTVLRNDILTKVPELLPLINIIDTIFAYSLNIGQGGLMLILGPIAYILGGFGLVNNLLTGYIPLWSAMAAPFVWVIGITGQTLGPKIEAYITFVMCLNIVLQVRHEWRRPW